MGSNIYGTLAGNITEVPKPVVDPFSTVIIHNSYESQAFSTAVGNLLLQNTVCSRFDTNLLVPNRWLEKAVWYGLEITIPVVIPKRFQNIPRHNGAPLGPAVLSNNDLLSFIDLTKLDLYVRTNDKPVFSIPCSFCEFHRTELRVRSVIPFQGAVKHEGEHCFLTLRLSFNSTVEFEQEYLPVMFRLLSSLEQTKQFEPAVPETVVAGVGALLQVSADKTIGTTGIYYAGKIEDSLQPQQIPVQLPSVQLPPSDDSDVDISRFSS